MVSVIDRAQPATKGIWGINMLMAIAVPITWVTKVGLSIRIWVLGEGSVYHLSNICTDDACFCHDPKEDIQPLWHMCSVHLSKIHASDRPKLGRKCLYLSLVSIERSIFQNADLKKDGNQVGNEYHKQKFILEQSSRSDICLRSSISPSFRQSSNTVCPLDNCPDQCRPHWWVCQAR